MEMPCLDALEVLAERSECALNKEMSIPAKDIKSNIQRAIVRDDAG